MARRVDERGEGVARARKTFVPNTELLASALTRIDWADAHAVKRLPEMPTDPHVWADALFRTPPTVVARLIELRDEVVGLVGITHTDESSFDIVASTTDEVLFGSDDSHLDFRGSVLVEPERVVLSSVVQIHGARGRAYFATVKLVHPALVRMMLTNAARRLSR